MYQMTKKLLKSWKHMGFNLKKMRVMRNSEGESIGLCRKIKI